MTEQEIFDKVYVHLLTQKKKSKDEDNFCLYRSTNGLMCAVGCLISDEEYSTEMEERTVLNLNMNFGLFEKEQIHFLNELQLIHDVDSVKEWKEKLKLFAVKYNLNIPKIPRKKAV